MKLFKLTSQKQETMGSTKWGDNITHKRPQKENPRLCCGDVLHAYTNQNLAFLLNPIHGSIDNPLLWEAVGDVVVKDYGKVGCLELTTTKRLDIPSWVGSDKDRLVRVQFAVLCARAVLSVWDKYNKNDNRVVKAIEAAEAYLKYPDAARAARAAAYAAGAAIDFDGLADKAVEVVMVNNK